MFSKSFNQTGSFSCNPVNYQNFADKKYWEVIDFSRCFGLIFTNSFDAEDIWNQIIENPATIMRNIDDFMKLKDTYMKELPVNKRIGLLSETKNLRKHVEKGCVSGIPTGAGTENNERLFRSKIKVAKVQQFYFMFPTAVLAMVTEEKLPFIALCLFKSHQRMVV